MPFVVTVERAPDHVRFNVAGSASLKNYFDLIDGAAKETVANGDKVGMVDIRQVVGRLSFTDQFFIGEIVGEKLGHLQKLATLVADDPTSYNSEKVANRKGVNLRTFDNEERAIAWLRESPARPAPRSQ
jgi:hypothetical protein